MKSKEIFIVTESNPNMKDLDLNTIKAEYQTLQNNINFWKWKWLW